MEKGIARLVWRSELARVPALLNVVSEIKNARYRFFAGVERAPERAIAVIRDIVELLPAACHKDRF